MFISLGARQESGSSILNPLKLSDMSFPCTTQQGIAEVQARRYKGVDHTFQGTAIQEFAQATDDLIW